MIFHFFPKFESNDSEDKVYITLSRTNLANMVRTARETLARILHDFREEQLIAMEGRKIQLKDIDRLTRIANL